MLLSTVPSFILLYALFFLAFFVCHFDISGYHDFLNSLFHVVVENDDKSTQIIRHLNSQKGGRVTFIPLNRVKAPNVAYPQSSDVIPLLKKLNFKHDYTPAFGQVSFIANAVFYLIANTDIQCLSGRYSGLGLFNFQYS